MLTAQNSGDITGQGASRRAAVAVTVAIAVFVAAWAGLHVGFYRHSHIADTPIYQRYGDAIANGHVPYRDFQLEYPPAALPVFALPSLLRSDDGDLNGYRTGFEAEMLVCGALTLAFMLSILLGLEAGPLRTWAALGFAAVAPLAIGSLMLSRFDLWPAALVTGSLAAFVAGRQRLGAGVLGLAVSAKLFPAVLVPIAAIWIWRRRGRREALVCLGIFAAVLALCFVPFLVLSPHGLWHSITTQTSRPLQIESFGAAVLLVAHVAGGLGITMQSSHGSQNLVGTGPDTLAAIQTVLQAAALVATWIWFARGPGHARAARAGLGDGGLRVRGLRQGALAPVPDLADTARAARSAVGAGWPRARCWRLRSWSRSSGSRSATGTSHCDSTRPRRGSSWLRDLVLVALFAMLIVPTGAGTRSVSIAVARPVGVAVDDDALEADAALGGAEADGHPGAHAPDRELGLDTDHRVVRPGHPGVGDRRGAAGLDPRVAGLDVGVRPDHGGHAAVEPARDGDLLAGRLGVEVDDDDVRRAAVPPRRARRAPRTARPGRRGTASPAR